MKNLDEVMVLGVVINNNLMGGYYLEVTTENMERLFTVNSVKEYADYVRVNRQFIDATLWFCQSNVSKDIAARVESEARQYPDLLLVEK